jgi:hypothetical protein
MTRLMTLLGAWLCALAFVVAADPARATGNNPFSYVSNTGNDSGTCGTPAAACATFQYALSQTAPYGEIDCLNGGYYGSEFTIEQSVTIDCAGGVGSTAGGIIVNGSGIVVRLRNLTFNGFGDVGYGTDVQNTAVLSVENCVITNANPANITSAFYLGIKFEPSANAQLFVSNSVISDNGSSTSGLSGGIYIVPPSGTTAAVTIDKSQITGNYFGIVADGRPGGIIKGTVSDSVVSGNSEDGIAAISSGSSVWFMVDQTEISGNAFGLAAGGSGTEILVSTSSVFNNTTGLHTSTGGALYSYGNNRLNGNASNGAFTGTVGLQ